MSSGKCIDCKQTFNRKVSVDKLRCKACSLPEETGEKWKKDLLKLKDKVKK